MLLYRFVFDQQPAPAPWKRLHCDCWYRRKSGRHILYQTALSIFPLRTDWSIIAIVFIRLQRLHRLHLLLLPLLPSFIIISPVQIFSPPRFCSFTRNHHLALVSGRITRRGSSTCLHSSFLRGRPLLLLSEASSITYLRPSLHASTTVFRPWTHRVAAPRIGSRSFTLLSTRNALTSFFPRSSTHRSPDLPPPSYTKSSRLLLFINYRAAWSTREARVAL